MQRCLAWNDLISYLPVGGCGTATPPTTCVSLARPDNAGGADRMPQIKHLVLLMMENHSFDNYLGTLGKGDGVCRPTWSSW